MSLELDYTQQQALRYAMWQGRRYLPGGGFTLDTEALVEAVTDVLTPVMVVEVGARVGIDEETLDDLWNRVRDKTAERVRAHVATAVADLEAKGIPVGDDAEAVDRALLALLDVHTVNGDDPVG